MKTVKDVEEVWKKLAPRRLFLYSFRDQDFNPYEKNLLILTGLLGDIYFHINCLVVAHGQVNFVSADNDHQADTDSIPHTIRANKIFPLGQHFLLQTNLMRGVRISFLFVKGI